MPTSDTKIENNVSTETSAASPAEKNSKEVEKVVYVRSGKDTLLLIEQLEKLLQEVLATQQDLQEQLSSATSDLWEQYDLEKKKNSRAALAGVVTEILNALSGNIKKIEKNGKAGLNWALYLGQINELSKMVADPKNNIEYVVKRAEAIPKEILEEYAQTYDVPLQAYETLNSYKDACKHDLYNNFYEKFAPLVKKIKRILVKPIMEKGANTFENFRKLKDYSVNKSFLGIIDNFYNEEQASGVFGIDSYIIEGLAEGKVKKGEYYACNSAHTIQIITNIKTGLDNAEPNELTGELFEALDKILVSCLSAKENPTPNTENTDFYIVLSGVFDLEEFNSFKELFNKYFNRGSFFKPLYAADAQILIEDLKTNLELEVLDLQNKVKGHDNNKIKHSDFIATQLRTTEELKKIQTNISRTQRLIERLNGIDGECKRKSAGILARTAQGNFYYALDAVFANEKYNFAKPIYEENKALVTIFRRGWYSKKLIDGDKVEDAPVVEGATLTEMSAQTLQASSSSVKQEQFAFAANAEKAEPTVENGTFTKTSAQKFQEPPSPIKSNRFDLSMRVISKSNGPALFSNELSTNSDQGKNKPVVPSKPSAEKKSEWTLRSALGWGSNR